MAKASKTELAYVKASTLMLKLEQLSDQRAEFEKNELARTNQRLYEILAEVYEQYEAVKSERSYLIAVTKVLTDNLKSKGQRVQDNTLVLALFVRMVFKSDRQRIHTYTRAIQAAHEDGVGPKEFAAYVTAQGGVEECRVKTKQTEGELKTLEAIEQGMPLVEEIFASPTKTALASFKVNPSLLKEIHGRPMAILLGEFDNLGNVKVVTVVPGYKESVVTWAKEKMAIHLANEQEKSKTEARKVEADTAIEDAVSVSRKVEMGTATVGELAMA